MESRKREEQQRRRANAETFRKRTRDSNPLPPKDLFKEPCRRTDETREEFVRMSEKIQDIFNLFHRKRSPSPVWPEAKQAKREIPKIDPEIDEIMAKIEGPELLLRIEAPKKESNEEKTFKVLSNEKMRSPSPMRPEIKKAKREIPKIDPEINEIMAQIEGPELLLRIEAPKKESNEEKTNEKMKEIEKLIEPPVLLLPLKTKRQNSTAIPRMRIRLVKEESTAERPIYTIVRPAVSHQ